MNIEELIEVEKKLAEYNASDKVVSSVELYKKLLEKRKRSFHLKTGIPKVDTLVEGFNAGELTVISGITGNGKTLLCQTLTADFADQGKHSLWFTYEVPALQFLKQFGENLPHFYMPSLLQSATLKWIHDRIYEAKVKYGLEAVFVDHLHFLADIMIKKNPSLEIGNVIRTVKRWALEFNVAFFLVAHMMKIKPDSEPSLGDCRDSSFVEQEADNVFYIWRKVKTDNEAILKIAKNRRFGVMNKKVKLEKMGNYLREVMVVDG